MFTYTVNKNTTPTAIKATVKQAMLDRITAMLTAEFGEENVAMVRTVTPSGTGKNVLAARVGTVTEDGFEFETVVVFDPSVKEWSERISSKTGDVWRSAFDFESAKDEFVKWEAQREAKAAAAAAKKEKQKAATAAAAAKRKAKEGA